MNVSEKQLPKLKKRLLTSLQKQQPNNRLGAQGEARAVQFLQNLGYSILETNIRLGNQEVDIIALDEAHHEVVFCEVKTRATDFYGSPSAAVGYRKIRSLEAVALAYLRMNKVKNDFRFDILAVLPDSIEHYPNITWEMVK